ncbi:hypothetical protein GCM10023157_09920 [Gluconacetobacter asukensis]
MLIANATCYQPRIRQIAASENDINILINQINNSILERDIEVDFRIASHKVRDKRHEKMLPDDMWHIHPQATTGCRPRVMENCLGIPDVVQRLTTPFVEKGASFRQSNGARGPIQKLYTHATLQP